LKIFRGEFDECGSVAGGPARVHPHQKPNPIADRENARNDNT